MFCDFVNSLRGSVPYLRHFVPNLMGLFVIIILEGTVSVPERVVSVFELFV